MTGDSQITSRRSSIQETASSYLPRWLIGCLCRRSLLPPWAIEVEGTLLMADISGFTALSEQLQQQGREGAERLTEIINRFFTRILRIAVGYGADILGYGGDAVLLLFEGETHATRAAACGLDMLEVIEKSPPVTVGKAKVKLGMSVGAHSSGFLAACVGRADKQQVLLVGSATEETAQAEGKASRGQMFVTASTAKLIGGSCCVEGEPGYWRVRSAPSSVQGAGNGKQRVRAEQEVEAYAELNLDGIRPHLPPWVADALESDDGRPASAPEHRRVSVAFVNVTGIDEIHGDEGVEAARDELQKYSVCLMDALDKHHGYLLSSDIATHGFKFILTFGAPVAHEYAAANAARFALEFNEQVQSGAAGRLRHRIGLNGGHVFAGEVGPDFRRQYTVMGDEVNLAARLMAAAEPGQIVASQTFVEGAGQPFCAHELHSLQVKGKAQPVPACTLGFERRSSGRQTAQDDGERSVLFGRTTELRSVQEAWEGAQEGRSSALLIEGEAGVGKTRLMEEALEEMPPDTRVVRAHSQEHKQSFPLAPWVEILDGLLGTSRRQTVEERTAITEAWLAKRLPELSEVASLLNPLLAVSFPVSQVVHSLDGQGRQQRLFQLIERMIAEAAADSPLVLLFEDLHWADDTSLELVQALARASVAGVLLVATTRPSDPPLDLGAQTSRLRLKELTESEATGMLFSALGVSELPDEVIETVYAKTRGNPLFLEEVVHALQAPGLLDSILSESSVKVSERLAALELPDRVQGLLMSRVDRLAPDSREVAKVASVIGQTFEEETLRGIDDSVLETVSLPAAFRDLLSAGLTVLERSRNGPTTDSGARVYRFRHALIQEVAYDSLPFARRQYLHGQIAHHLESQTETPDHGLLVHHYRHAGDGIELRDHAVKAAQASSAVYAQREGIDYLALAMDTLTARTPEQACLRSRIEEEMGDYFDALGMQEEAVKRYRKSRERWRSSAVRRASECALAEILPITDADSREAELCCKIAATMVRSHGAYGRVIRWLDHADEMMPRGNIHLACRLKSTRSLVYTHMGRHQEAVTLAEESVELAGRSGDVSLEAYALTRLFPPCAELGLIARGLDAGRRAVKLYEESGDIAAQAVVHGNLGVCCHAIGDVKGALAHYDLAQSLNKRLGYSTGLAIVENNISEIMLMMGRFDEALQHLDKVFQHCREQEAVSMLGTALCSSAYAKIRLGRLEEAASDLEEARACLKAAQAEPSLLDAELVKAELDRALGREEEALMGAEQVLRKTRAVDSRLVELSALLFLASTHNGRNEHEAAEVEINQALQLAQDMEMLYEQGLAQFELARLYAASGQADPVPSLEEALAIFERMSAEYDLARAHELSESLAG